MKTILFMLFTAISLSVFSQNTSVVQLEYFFDTDNGFGKNKVVNVTPAADGSFPFTANITGLAVGYHKLYIRTKDTNGKWSLTARRNIEVFASAAKTTIVRGEYFIDVDPGYGNGKPITIVAPDSVVLQSFVAATAGLSTGYHKLYGRVLDNNRKWSLTFRRNIEIYKSDTPYITKAEYFFTTDKGFGNCTSVVFATSSVDGSFSFNIPLNEITTVADTLFIRVQDNSRNRWSITQIKDISVVLPLTQVSFTANKQNTTALLKWQTVNEINTSHFVVQRSTDGVSFTNIGKVAAANLGNEQNIYSFTDDLTATKADKIYYRLQIADNDGKITYSSIASVNNNIESYFTVFPDPAKDILNVSIKGSISLITINIFDLKGVKVKSLTAFGGQVIKISISELISGIYILQAYDGKKMQIARFIKQ
jgi:hypothetical protein